MRHLLPPTVSLCEVWNFAGGDSRELLPEEESAIRSAVPRRIAEFIAGRRCARQAMAAHGFIDQPVPRGLRREPIWPRGLVGSITHCSGYVAAAVGAREDLFSLGIDAEPLDELPARVVPHITTPPERRWLSEQGARSSLFAKVLFSAKESIYKAWYPLTGEWLGFQDACVNLTSDGRLIARISPEVVKAVPGAPPEFSGGFWIGERYIFTAVVVPALSGE